MKLRTSISTLLALSNPSESMLTTPVCLPPSLIRYPATFQGIAHLDEEKREFITQWLMPNVFRRFEEVLSVIPEQRKIVLNEPKCNDAHIPEELQGVKIDADLVIFVMGKVERSNLTLASASSCFLHPETGRYSVCIVRVYLFL